MTKVTNIKINKEKIKTHLQLTILSLIGSYLVVSNGLLLIMQLLGMKMIIFHPYYPITDEYVLTVNILPQLLQFLYIIAASIILIGTTLKKKKK